MMLQQYPALLVVLPLLLAPLTVMLNRATLAWVITSLMAAACLYMSIHLAWAVFDGSAAFYEMGGWAPPWGIVYQIDALNALVAVTVSLVLAATMMFARKSVEQEIPEHLIPLFYAALQLCYLGLIGIALTGDIFNLFVFLEVSSLSSYALIAMGSKRKALTAAFHYLVLGTLGATFFLIGVGFAFAATGSLNMADLSVRLAELDSPQLLHTAFAFIVVGIALKAAVYPVHLWLPNAYAYAPSVVSIFLAATATKVAIYVLVRCLFDVFSLGYFISTWLPLLMIVLGGVAIIYGSVRALLEEGMKKMLAYSSVAQIGYMIMGIGFVNHAGMTASLIHLFNHALMKAALFMAAGVFIYRVNTATLDNLRGLGREMPWTFLAMVIAGLSLIGVPGTVGFISKWQLMVAATESSHWSMIAIIIIGSLLAVMYVWKLVEVMYFSTPEKPVIKNVESGSERIGRSPPGMVAATWLMAIACIYFGFDTDTTLGLASTATELLLGGAQ